MKDITSFLYEIAQLKYIPRYGWFRTWNKQPESVAEHTLIATQLGYILADIEGANKLKVMEMLVFHENGETRIADHDKILARYIDKSDAELKALTEQVSKLPASLASHILANHIEMEEKETLEAQIVKDADYLECCLQACIYRSTGNIHTQNWIDNIGKALRTDSAKKLYEEMVQQDPNEWMNGLKKVEKLYE